MRLSFLLTFIFAICFCTYVTAEVCPEFDPFEYPVWPTNPNITFGVQDVSDTNLLVTFTNVQKYWGALQYIRVAPINATDANIVRYASFDSGVNATLNGESYSYGSYDSMFSNAKYTTTDNQDCSVNIQINFPIQQILAAADVFTITNGQDLIQVDVPFYLGYAVPSRQTGVSWQYQENLYIARLIINTLVRADGTRDVLNVACSSTVSGDQKGIIVCFYTSTSPLRLEDFSVDVTGSSLTLNPFYLLSTAGRTEVMFATVQQIQSVAQLNAQVRASVCVVGAGNVCTSTSSYLSPSIPYTFRTGLGEIELEQEATLLFSTTITRFDAETDANTIIGASPEFFILVQTSTPKSIWRIAPGTDQYTVRLTAPPKYNLPSYPIFPTGNTVTVFTEGNFPDNIDPNVRNSEFISYVLRFDNSRERYSRASEDPILFQVQFNIENRDSRRRLNAVDQPSGIFVTKELRSQCVGDDCVVDFTEENSSARSVLSLGLALVLCIFWIVM